MKKILAAAAFLLLGTGLATLRADEDLDRQWTIYLVHHTHTDIGYTRPQSEILSEHLRYIDTAVEYCSLTDGYDDASKFRWTCESVWAVAQYIKCRPASQVDKLIGYINSGRIEVTAMYFNMAEIVDEAALRYFFLPLHELKARGIRVKLAMQNDVNGIPWAAVDILSRMGVKYMWVGSNKTKSLIPFGDDNPTVWKWLSPSGNSLLTYRAEHYMTANLWGLDKCDEEEFGKNCTGFLRKIAAKGYSGNIVAIQYAGLLTDNAPPSLEICDFIDKWNDTHDNPKLKTATASDFMDYVSGPAHYTGIQSLCVAWPDWWTDGFGSAAKETAQVEKAQKTMMKAGGLLSMGILAGYPLPQGTNEEIRDIYDNILFYDEHTFGAAESITDPDCWNSQIQFDNKASYAWNSIRKSSLLVETAAGILQDKVKSLSVPTLTIFNPLAWKRDAYADVFINFNTVPQGCKFTIVDEKGHKAKYQALSMRKEGMTYKIAVKDIPSLGYKTYSILIDSASVVAASHGGNSTDGTPYQMNVAKMVQGGGKTLESKYYRIEIDTKDGGIASIWDKEGGREVVDKDNLWAFGEMIYERINNERMRTNTLDFTDVKRTGIEDMKIEGTAEGALFKSIMLSGKCSASKKRVQIEIRSYVDKPLIELCYNICRQDNDSPNSVYVALPFGPVNSTLSMDVQGGIMYPRKNQLEGSCKAWNTMQNYICVTTPEKERTILCSPTIPLVQLSEMLPSKVTYEKKCNAPFVFSWVMNNYWFTNFKSSQSGEFSWNYFITSTGADTNDAGVMRFALETNTEVLARVLPPRKKSLTDFKVFNPMERSYLSVKTQMLVVPLSVFPASFHENAIIMQIRNTGKTKATVSVQDNDGKLMKMTRVNALEEGLALSGKEFVMEPLATEYFLVEK